MSEVKILVVDDEMIVCESCKRILEEEGYEVETALSGKEAFEKMKANPFDIVITDLKMPGIDGMEVLKNIPQGVSRFNHHYDHRFFDCGNRGRGHEIGSLRLHSQALYA